MCLVPRACVPLGRGAGVLVCFVHAEHLHVETFNEYWLTIALLRYVTYHAMHPSKVHNPVIVSVFARLCHCHPNSRTFSLSQKETPSPLARTPHPPAAPSHWAAFCLCRFMLMEPYGTGLVTGVFHWAWCPPSPFTRHVSVPPSFSLLSHFPLGCCTEAEVSSAGPHCRVRQTSLPALSVNPRDWITSSRRPSLLAVLCEGRVSVSVCSGKTLEQNSYLSVPASTPGSHTALLLPPSGQGRA